MAKLHYLKFYPESWIAEIGLRMCSLAARGLWIDLICHMAKSPEHGVLLTMAGKPITDGQVAAFVGIEPNTVLDALKELEENAVLSRRSDGAIFSRRMVRDHAEYVRQAAFGSKGGRSKRGGLEGTLKGTLEAPLEGPLEGPLEACVGSSFLVVGSTSSSSPENATPDSGGSAARFLSDRRIRTNAAPPGFNRFIAEYPSGRAKDRPAALAQWEASECEDATEAVLAGLARWKACDDWREGCVDNADKFLRLRMWEQQPPAPKVRTALGGAW